MTTHRVRTISKRLCSFLGQNLLAIAALTVAASGTAYAATIGSAEIIDDSVLSADVRNGNLQGIDVRDGTIRGADLASAPWQVVRPASIFGNCDKKVGEFCAPVDGYYDRYAWTNYGEPWQPARYRKDVTGEVTLQGLVKSRDGFERERTIFVLPEGHRPAQALIFAVACGGEDGTDAAGTVDVFANGRVTWRGNDRCDPQAHWLSLTSISLPAG